MEFLRYARESYDGPLPRYVEDELRGYLRCGDFSRGFVHLQCPRCEHDVLVPFSCKNRGLPRSERPRCCHFGEQENLAGSVGQAPLVQG